MERVWGAKRKEREVEEGRAQRVGTGAGPQAKSRRTAAPREASTAAFRVFSPHTGVHARSPPCPCGLAAHPCLVQHENVIYEDGDGGHIQRMLRCCAALCRITVSAAPGNSHPRVGNGFLAAVEHQGRIINQLLLLLLYFLNMSVSWQVSQVCRGARLFVPVCGDKQRPRQLCGRSRTGLCRVQQLGRPGRRGDNLPASCRHVQNCTSALQTLHRFNPQLIDVCRVCRVCRVCVCVCAMHVCVMCVMRVTSC